MVIALGHSTTLRHEQEMRERLLPLDGQVVTAMVGHRFTRLLTGTLVLPEEGGRIGMIVGPDRSWLAPLGELHQVYPV